ncbi:MAG: hypothetical protein Q7R22_003975 [Verrucomicrobiota bacterium JB025]
MLTSTHARMDAASIFFANTTDGAEATVPTAYGDSIYVMRPGVNVNPAFKVEDGETNWAKNDGSGFSPSADMEPISVSDIPIINYNGNLYIALGIDFNEAGSTPDFDVVNLMLWSGPSSANTQSVATATDPDIASLAWPTSVTSQEIRSWDNNMLEMSSNDTANSALGINLIYEQNAAPQLFVDGDTMPYGSDSHRVYSEGLATLGSNEVDVAILVPASVLTGLPLDDVIYLGMQTGALADGGSDRFGIVDPTTVISGGYFDSIGVTFSTIPEPKGASLLALTMAGLVWRRRRA